MAYKWSAACAVILALAACSSEPAPTEPEAKPTAPAAEGASENTPAEGEQESIFRPDSDVNHVETKLQPLAARISFDEGGAELSKTAIAELQTVLATRQFEAGGKITLHGHTDSAGYDEANLRASLRRADAVKDWLVKNGVSAARITVVAMGEQNPARPNAKADGSPDEAGRAFNRRVDVTIAVPQELIADSAPEKKTLVEQVSDN